MRRILVVGLGSIGRRHVRILSESKRVTGGEWSLEICDTNQQSREDCIRDCADKGRGELSKNIPTYSNFNEALQTQPEAVLIATPHHLHASMACSALERGIPVLCEKPMSDSVSEAKRMKAASESSGALLSIGFMNHFRPGAIRLKQLIEEGKLGKILQFSFHVGSYQTLVNSVSRYQESLVGALLLDYAHQPDLVYWLLGEKPKGVYVRGTQGGDMEYSSNPNVLSMLLDYDSPLLSVITLNYVQMAQHDYCEVVGDKGWAFWEIQRQTIETSFRKGNSEKESLIQEEEAKEIRNELYAREHEHFFRALDGENAPESPPKEAIVSQYIIEAAQKSFLSGGREELYT